MIRTFGNLLNSRISSGSNITGGNAAYVNSVQRGVITINTVDNGTVLTSVGSNSVIAIGIMQGGTGNTCAITDDKGNTYVGGTGNLVKVVGSDHKLYVFYAKAVSAGTTTITITYGSSATGRIIAAEISGCSLTTPLDQSGTATAVNTAPTSATINTTGSISEILAFFSFDNNVNLTLDTNYTERQAIAATNALRFYLETRHITSSGSNSCINSILASEEWGSIILNLI